MDFAKELAGNLTKSKLDYRKKFDKNLLKKEIIETAKSLEKQQPVMEVIGRLFLDSWTELP